MKSSTRLRITIIGSLTQVAGTVSLCFIDPYLSAGIISAGAAFAWFLFQQLLKERLEEFRE